MQCLLVCVFLLIAVAPFWARWRVHVWSKENMPEEETVPPYLSDLDMTDHSPELSYSEREGPTKLVTIKSRGHQRTL